MVIFNFTYIFSFVKNYYRQILWITLGLLFILDIITTAIGLQIGGQEKTSFMIPFVQNPFHHLIIKIIAFCIIWTSIEPILNWLNNISLEEKMLFNKLCFAVTYWILILGLVYVIGLFFTINLNNITFIISHASTRYFF